MSNNKYIFKKVETVKEHREIEKVYNGICKNNFEKNLIELFNSETVYNRTGFESNEIYNKYHLFYIKIDSEIKAIAKVSTFEEKGIVHVDFICSEPSSKCRCFIIIELMLYYRKLSYSVLTLYSHDEVLNEFYEQFDPVSIEKFKNSYEFIYKINDMNDDYLKYIIYTDMNLVVLSSCCDDEGTKNIEFFKKIKYCNEYQYIGDILVKLKSIKYKNNNNYDYKKYYPTDDKLYEIITKIKLLKSAKISSAITND